MLRSVNVGGRNRLAMDGLRSLMGALGFDDVATYLQSGNVTFAGTGSARDAGEAIERAIATGPGLEVRVLVRTRTDLAGVLRATPFGHLDVDPRTLHVSFLDVEPERSVVEALADRDGSFGADRFEVVGREVYLHCPGGYGNTKLNNGYLERSLGVTATTRNWRTVVALAERCGAAGSAPHTPL